MSYDPLEVIARESAALVRAANGNLDAQVPSCPDWKVRDLVQHLGMVQRFHALHVARGVTDEPTERPTAHEGDHGLLEWFEESTRALLGALDLPDETPAWNWATGTPQRAGFWPRRMALEAAIHRWDAESARADGSGFDLDVAVDGIDEVLTLHLPSDRAAEASTEPGNEQGVVQVRLTDDDAGWTIELARDSVVPVTQKTPDAVLEGTASGVFLALWGRIPLSSLEVRGDESLVAALRTG